MLQLRTGFAENSSSFRNLYNSRHLIGYPKPTDGMIHSSKNVLNDKFKESSMSSIL